jgi:hypothetical protein
MSAEVFWIVFPLWIRAFFFTLAVEIPLFVLVAGFRNRSGRRAPLWRLVLAGAAGTAVTHPALWFVWPRVVSDYTLYIATGELLVAVVETFTFFGLARPISLSRAAAASFIANGASYGLGMLLHLLGVWE